VSKEVRKARKELRALRRFFAERSTTERGVITPEAGGVVSAGGVTLTVPPGAVSERVVVKMTVPNGSFLYVKFQPHGLVFNKPATLAFDLSGVQDRELDELLGAYLGDEKFTGKNLNVLETYPVTVEGGSAAFQINHFSGYIVASGYWAWAF
jgi:hypothetical protein